MPLSTCKHCGLPFTSIRAGAQYCSQAHRTAACRARSKPEPHPLWIGEEPTLSPISRSFHADGSHALSNEELGEALLWIANEGDGGRPKTGRRFYYLALHEGFVRPPSGATKEAKKERDATYKRILKVLKTLRKQGRLGWDAVIDLTRELVEWQTYGSTREARAMLRQRYDEDRWLGQRYFPILAVEKDTVEPTTKPIAMRWQMPFASSRGYGSLTLLHDVADLVIRRHAQTGQHSIIYFISDLDPSGLDLQRAWSDALDDFDAVAVLVRIGLTRDQVELDVPAGRLREGLEVKLSDSRAKAYIAEYGDRCWEVDILPETAIEREIDDSINSWLDRDMWQRRDADIEQARKLL